MAPCQPDTKSLDVVLLEQSVGRSSGIRTAERMQTRVFCRCVGMGIRPQMDLRDAVLNDAGTSYSLNISQSDRNADASRAIVIPIILNAINIREFQRRLNFDTLSASRAWHHQAIF